MQGHKNIKNYCMEFELYNLGLQTFHGTGPHPLLWSGSRVARGQISISGTPKCRNYYKMLQHVHSFQIRSRAA